MNSVLSVGHFSLGPYGSGGRGLVSAFNTFSLSGHIERMMLVGHPGITRYVNQGPVQEIRNCSSYCNRESSSVTI